MIAVDTVTCCCVVGVELERFGRSEFVRKSSLTEGCLYELCIAQQIP